MNNRLVSLAVVTLGANLIAFGSGVAQAADVECGATIVTNTKLDGNVSCISLSGIDGITIGAHGVKLNLNGYTIEGDPAPGASGVFNVGFDDVTIKNGEITGFQDGIRADRVTDLDIKDLEFSGQRFSSIVIVNSVDVKIKRVFISQPLGGGAVPPYAEAIRLANVDGARVTNATVDGGFFGLLSVGDPGAATGSEVSTEIDVTGNTFTNATQGIRIINTAGIRIRRNRIVGTDGECATGIDTDDLPPPGVPPSTFVRILENVITGCGDGIFVRAVSGGPTTDMYIRNNNVSANTFCGICLGNTTDSGIVGNRVHFNGDVGISLVDVSTGNMISENQVTGQGRVDLSHEETSSPNTWTNNTFGTCEGLDIGVGCPP